jgi:hypothetical protein
MFNKLNIFFLFTFLFFGLLVEGAPAPNAAVKRDLKQLKLKRGDVLFNRDEKKPPKPSLVAISH